jgi:hypothetical protein
MYSIEPISATWVCLTGPYKHFHVVTLTGKKRQAQARVRKSCRSKMKAINPGKFKLQVDFAPLEQSKLMAEKYTSSGGQGHERGYCQADRLGLDDARAMVHTIIIIIIRVIIVGGIRLGSSCGQYISVVRFNNHTLFRGRGWVWYR